MKGEKEFLHKLRELTLSTGIVVGGCGCCQCGSFSLQEVEEEELTEKAGYANVFLEEPSWTPTVIWVSPKENYGSTWWRNLEWQRFKARVVY